MACKLNRNKFKNNYNLFIQQKVLKLNKGDQESASTPILLLHFFAWRKITVIFEEISTWNVTWTE